MRSGAVTVAVAAVMLAPGLGGAWDGPFEKAGPNLCRDGDFEGAPLSEAWKWNNNKGGFAVKRAPGRGGGPPGNRAAALVSTRTSGRGKFWTKGFGVPAGADVRVSLWAKAEEHVGGTWVNFEGEPGEGFSKFDIAGGTYDWTQYVHRTTIPLKKFRKGRTVRLELWFYVYGTGTLLIDDVECRVIEPDPALRARWAEKRTREIVQSAASWKGKRPRGLRSLAREPDGPDALRRLLDAIIPTCARAASGSRSWGILATDPIHRVLRDVPFQEGFSTAVDIDMARHEFEGAQLLLFAYEEDLKDVSVAAGDLTGPGTIAAENIQVLPVAYGDRSRAPRIPWYEGRTSRHWPDPLLPNRPFTVARGTVQPVYLRLYCPREAKAGTYRGSLKIKTSAGTAEMPVFLTVHDVTMPVRLHIRSMCVGGKSDRPYLDLSLEQRMPIGNIATGMSWAKPKLPAKGNSFDFSGVEKKLQYCIDRGMNAFIMASTPKSGKWGFPKNYSAGWKTNMSKVIREYGGWLKRKGWLDMAYYNNIDEPGRGRWGQCKELYRMAEAANPDVKVFHCVNMIGALDALKGHADTWDVYIQQADQQQSAARSREGAEIWWAVCVWPKEHPNLFVEYPLMDARVIGWAAFKYDVAGFEYWQMTSWNGAWRNRGGKAPADGSWVTCPGGTLTTAWPYDRKRSGDGYLCYPGEGAGPINSLRFEALRDGLEDFELLYQLEQRLPALSGRAKAEAVKLLARQPGRGDGPVTNMFLYSTDPARLLAARRRVFRLLTGRIVPR